MKNIMNWKIFTESNKSSMSVDQLNDLEDYLYEFFGFDRENLDSDEIEKIKKRFDPTSKDFVDFLDSLDSNFDWFDYRMVPEIKDYINGIIHDYWEVDNNGSLMEGKIIEKKLEEMERKVLKYKK